MSRAAPFSHHHGANIVLVRRLKLQLQLLMMDSPHISKLPSPHWRRRDYCRNGNIDGKSIPDHVEVPPEETEDDVKNTLIDSESESENESEFGDNGYIDPTSTSEGEESDEQFRPQGSDLVSP